MRLSLFRNLFSMIFIVGAVFAIQARSERTALNSIYAEGLGPGLLYLFNYERLVINDLGVRLGMSYMSVSTSAGTNSDMSKASVAFMTFPLTASYLGISSGSHTLEMGGGTTILYASGTASGTGVEVSGSGIAALGNILIGYRIHPVKGGFQFRVGFTGIFGKGLGFAENRDPNAFGFLPWFHISFGGCF